MMHPSSINDAVKHIAVAMLLTFGLCGCATTPAGVTAASPAPAAAPQFAGSIHGGQQPIAGVTIKLYAAGQTGYGSAATYSSGDSLLGTNVVKTNANGQFGFNGEFTCPAPDTLVYLVGTGGTPVPGQPANRGVALMAPLGPCGAITDKTFVSVNELTTVASIWALAPFMDAHGTVGTSAQNQTGLLNAFATISKLVDPATGKLSGPGLPADAVLPAAELNTLANILAACVNSAGGVAGDGSACGSLFALSPAADGTSPADLISAGLNMARNPARNVAGLSALVTPSAPFQPILQSTAGDWTIAIKHKASGSLASPSGIAADQQGNLWIANTASGTVVKLNTNGAVLSGTTGYAAGQAGAGVIAVDQAGNAWVPGTTAGSILRISGAQTTTFTGGGLSATTSLAVDRQGVIWAVGTSSTVSAFNAQGVALSPTQGFGGGSVSGVQSIAISAK